MTLLDVSRMTGLSVGFLSQIERNQSTPSLTSLRKVASALDSSLLTLLAGDSDGVRVVRRGERTRLTRAGSTVTYELLSPTRATRVEFLCAVLEAGMSTGERPSVHAEGEEFALVLDGTVSIEVGTQRYELEAGDSICFNSSIPHRYWNPGSAPATVLTATSPPQL